MIMFLERVTYASCMKVLFSFKFARWHFFLGVELPCKFANFIISIVVQYQNSSITIMLLIFMITDRNILEFAAHELLYKVNVLIS